MGWDLKVENPEEICFITIRTINSKLWLISNPRLDLKVLTFLARYQNLHGVVLYAFILVGNHYHMIAGFNRGNRADFTRDFNARFTGLLKAHVDSFEGGKIWARPYRTQNLPRPEDVECWFLYAALNPVSSGLVERIGDYTSYNSFNDAVSGIVRKFDFVNWSDFNNRKRYNRNLKIKDCTISYQLKFSRLPGYENMTQEEYKKLMHKKLEQRRLAIVAERLKNGLGFAGKKVILNTKPGTSPRNTKTSLRNTKRPLVLTLCAEAKRIYLDWYFGIQAAYIEASKRFRAGDFNVLFPKGTYRPPCVVL